MFKKEEDFTKEEWEHKYLREHAVACTYRRILDLLGFKLGYKQVYDLFDIISELHGKWLNRGED